MTSVSVVDSTRDKLFLWKKTLLLILIDSQTTDFSFDGAANCSFKAANLKGQRV